MADFEDSTTPTWENLLDGQLNLLDAIRRTITFDDPTTNKHYSLIDNPAVLFVRAARLAPRRAPHRRRWRIHVRLPLRLRPLSLPQRAASSPLAAPAPTSICPRSSRTSKPASGTTSSSAHEIFSTFPAAPIKRHRAHRNHPRHLRDGRDPLRAPRPLRRPQLRPLGLHLLLHQKTRRRHLRPPPRPLAGHHDHALHAQLLQALHQDLPSPRRSRHGRHVRVHSHQVGPRGQRARPHAGPRRQGTRGLRRP